MSEGPNRPAPPLMRFEGIHWPYSAAELWADGFIHLTGVLLAMVGCVLMLVSMSGGSGVDMTAMGIYLASLSTSIAASAAYNLWPVSRIKWWLRRLDHSAIYFLIAGTYTPFTARLGLWWLLGAVWAIALLGIGLKVFLPGRLDRLSIVLYLGLGWSGVMVLDKLTASFSPPVLWLIAAGGMTYSVGVIFHLWRQLRFQNAVWHAFVLVAATLHYLAVWSALGAVS